MLKLSIIKYSQIKENARTSDDAQSDDDDDDSADILEAILVHVGQREDTGYDDDGVDVSVGFGVGAIVGVGVNGQGVSVCVGLGVCQVVASPPLTLSIGTVTYVSIKFVEEEEEKQKDGYKCRTEHKTYICIWR